MDNAQAQPVRPSTSASAEPLRSELSTPGLGFETDGFPSGLRPQSRLVVMPIASRVRTGRKTEVRMMETREKKGIGREREKTKETQAKMVKETRVRPVTVTGQLDEREELYPARSRRQQPQQRPPSPSKLNGERLVCLAK
jgi:hypothetical protein